MINQLNLVVRDIDAATDFYSRLGLEFADRRPDHRNATRAGALDFDLDSRSFARVWNSGAADASAVVIGFGVASREEVDRLCAELAAAGHRVQQRPYDAFWGARYAVVEDPDGNPVGLMSPIDPARRTWPPEPAPR
jgi:catechol 2,3-dioxygenase-like lactoylglutathione lyase family enzyme